MKEIIENIGKVFRVSDALYQSETQTFITVDEKQAVPMVTHLRDHEGFSHLILLTAVDWIEDGVFQLTYLLNNPEKKVDLGVRCMINRNNAVMESAHHLWKQMATYQRELKEMYGIDFPGSPRVDEAFLLEGWDDIPPMRREFDTKKYSEETYFPREGRKTNDPAKHMQKKLYPEIPNPNKKLSEHED